MNKLKLALIAAGAALALSATQAAANPISMGVKFDHVTVDGKEGGKVLAIMPGRTGAAIGFKVGDILIEAGGRPITPAVLKDYVQSKKPGDALTFKVMRGAEVVELKGNAVAIP